MERRLHRSMTEGAETNAARPARHELPIIDELGLEAARHADRLLVEADARGQTRWVAFVRPLPDRLRDEGLPGLRAAAVRARAAYGPKDSIRDALPPELTEPFLDSIDRLLREINREVNRARG
jgi:hypothetical protein